MAFIYASLETVYLQWRFICFHQHFSSHQGLPIGLGTWHYNTRFQIQKRRVNNYSPITILPILSKFQWPAFLDTRFKGKLSYSLGSYLFQP